MIDIEAGKQAFQCHQTLQIGREGMPSGEQIHQEGRRARLEPERPEFPFLEQQQQVERVVYRIAGPVVAVVPPADLFSIQARQFGGEHAVHIGIGIATDRRITHIHGDIVEIVQPREQAHLAELRHPGEHGETNVRIAVLDHRI